MGQTNCTIENCRKIVVGMHNNSGRPGQTVLEIPTTPQRLESFLRDWPNLMAQGYTWFSFIWANQVITFTRQNRGVVRTRCVAQILGFWV